MNLIVAFVIVCCFVASELSAPQVIEDTWTRVAVMLGLMIAVPGAALVQTLILAKRHRESELTFDQQNSLLNRLSISHTAVWLCSSLAMILAVRWQDVVRANWNLDRWPLVDEILIAAPIILALVGSWAVFYEIDQLFQRRSSNASPKRTNSLLVGLKERIAYVAIRFRVHILMVMVPLLIVALARDLIPTGPPEKVILFGCVFAAIIAATYPFLILLIWRTSRLDDRELESELKELCRSHRIGVRSIRVWKTNQQILNAAIAGLIPGLRVLVLTDEMLDKFSREEIRAVVRHEAGHIRMNHFARRLGFVLLPLIALFIDQQISFGVHATLDQLLLQIGVANGAVTILSVAYVVYLWTISRRLFRQMEFEADHYSAVSSLAADNQPSLDNSDPNQAAALISALQKFAAYCPNQFEKASGLHPSLRNRIARIAELN